MSPSSRRVRSLGRRLEPQGGRECRALAGRARHQDVAPHGARQAAGDGEPQPGAALAAAHGILGLLELGEQRGQRVGRDAHAGVLHRDGDLQVVVVGGRLGVGGLADGHEHTARIGELDGVAEQIGDDLAHAHLVAQQRARQRRIDRPGDLDALLVGLRRQQLHHALHALVDRQRGGIEVQLVGLDLGEVEDLVDQGEQRARRALDGVGVGALLGGEVRIGQQRRHAEDAVHRRADLVAHGGQEARLGAVGGFRLLARLPQLGLRVPPLGDVAAGALHLGDGGIAGRDRMLLPLEPARPERGLDLLHVALLALLASPAPGAQACRRPSRGG